MSPRKKDAEHESPAAVELNEVRLVGRLSVAPALKQLPSGDVLGSFRVVVGRGPDQRSKHTSVDALECVVWVPRMRRTVERWRAGDVVEVEGALRRRFFKTPAGAASRVEVEVTRGRRVRRATT